jgi:hypothetical protein
MTTKYLLPDEERAHVQTVVACLRYWITRRRKRRRYTADAPPLRAWRASEVLGKTDAEVMGDILVTDLVCETLRAEVREAGWQAHVRGGWDEMQRVLGLIEKEIGPNDAPLASAIIDKWWDRIGNWWA